VSQLGGVVAVGGADEDGLLGWHPISNTPRTTRLLQAPIFVGKPPDFVLSMGIVSLSPLAGFGWRPVRQKRALTVHLQPRWIHWAI
jgi:hypothetical protein